MKNILLIGAGRSSSALIDYLLDYTVNHDIRLTVGDVTLESARSKTGNRPGSEAIAFDVNNAEQRISEIEKADIVISLLPPHLHQLMAIECVNQGKHFLTASYLTDKMRALHLDAEQKGILMLNECGLDPGIDHMSAMECIHRLQSEGAELLSFKSYTGGLIAPESNDNPWGYKFTWNPRNVILAGQGTARYIQNSNYKYIPYNRLFTDIETVEVKSLGRFDGYANRDSLAYRSHYGIMKIPTLLRGTLRNAGFCRAWDVFVKLGLTDDSYRIESSESLTYAELIRAFLPSRYNNKDLDVAVADFCELPVDGEAMTKIKWTGIMEEEPMGLANATPAMLLQNLLESKWQLKPNDKDMIVMQHEFGFISRGTKQTLTSALVVKGTDQVHTAMAKTVGLPLAVVAKLLAENKLKVKGVQIPVLSEIYIPVLRELKELGISFEEHIS